ncbi:MULTISPECIES: RNA polymerase sigma factor [unclassified Pedobacter]|uniref:RNA polymerase sigma factor n=1 Tax=unclassified Pedobacter TaxID=2628915 RepID=UPI001423138F|nr:MULTISPECIES: RNA polymerase sigma-70 factor [unclassified Pedobacter]NII81358.1 RNA polymerase sigma-70 factor (ECF subfamily) [Pedobacter sp. SG908]
MAEAHDFSDAELTELLREGDRGAFTVIYNNYWKLLFQTAYRILNNTIAAEDIVQDIFVSLWNRKNEAVILNLKAYLQQATRFAVYEAIRQRKHDSNFYNRLALITADIITDNPLLFKEQQELLSEIINALPEDCKESFRLSREEGMTYKQIAAVLGISEKTVEKRITKSLKHIRKGLSLSGCLSVLTTIFF